MDNFILYDEISKSNNYIVYKGRRKGSINFVAIHCIDKCMRPEITNLVRLTYEIKQKNIVKFYEWYETSNHLWLVVELCTGGTLESLIKQDTCLPESSIKQFGVDICEGLCHAHSMGIVFCDLQPRKIMIDGQGNLKLSDFGIAKLENETLDEIFQDATDSSYKPRMFILANINKKIFGDPNYVAPEILNGEESSKPSDLWSLGCLLYEMYTGHPPFFCDNIDQLVDNILHKDLPNPKGNKLSTKPSADFLSLLKGLLEKSATKRMNWKQIQRHPFWEGKLLHLVAPVITKPTFNVGNSAKESTIVENLEINVADSHLSTDRPKTGMDQKPEMNVSFSISSRLPTSPKSTIAMRTTEEHQESVVHINVQSQQENKNDYRKLFFMNTDLATSQIIDNPRIQKLAPLKFEAKLIPITNTKILKAETFLQLPREEFMKQLEFIKSNTNVPSDKSASAIKSKLQLMNFIGYMCLESTQLADEFVQIELYKDLLSIIKSGHNLEMKMKAARIFAVMFSRAKKLDPKKELTDILQILSDIISTNRKDLKLKQALLPSLGELLHLICLQESIMNRAVESWSIPSLAYLLIIRSVGDDLTVNHMVCKIIEKIASTNSLNVQKFLSQQSDVVNSLWSCFTHSSNNEQLRVTVLNALCFLTSHSVSIFQTLIDKIGLDPILDCLSSTNSRILQSILTMLAMYINEVNLKNIPEKKLISSIIHIYDCTTANCRSSVYLLSYIILKQNNDLLALFSQSKLIVSIERDFRKNFTNKDENEYIHRILGYLVSIIQNISITIIDELITTLDLVSGRKNPSTTQTKQLKRVIPNSFILKQLIACHTFRTRILDETFLLKFSRIIQLSRTLNNGELNLDTICGQGFSSDYLNVIIVILETIAQSKEALEQFAETIIQHLLPPLIENIDGSNSDLSVESLRSLSEICCILLNTKEQIIHEELQKQLKWSIETYFVEILDKVLIQPEPVPFFGLNIMELIFNMDLTVVQIFRSKNILPMLFKLLSNYKNKLGTAMILKLLNIFNLWSSINDPSDLYENGIVDCLKTLFNEVQKIKRIEDKAVIDTIIQMLRILDNLLKYVSEFVKKALQAKKVAGSTDSLAQQAEKLLQANKPLIGICSYLITLLLNDDNDIAELSSKVLWVIMQLFGGECKDLLNQENINIFLSAILHSNQKRQKILLRIVKRIITADKANLELFKTIGHTFVENLKNLKKVASSEANITLSNMIDEILKLV